ncbi:hypothetical protein [Variovorax sp. PAMC26660]|uniref:hypothetical protein n=1 Tax=Variovorax sp. PAMC26660 TaxID=2762322 RepID=UPI001C9B22A9|nr:hypothetical protein [Variovorax sp. PAMC26660]
MDYSYYYRRTINVQRIKDELQGFDVFISAYNSSDRVKNVYGEVRAARSYWVIHPEYQYAAIERPQNGVLICPASLDEVAQVGAIFDAVGDLSGLRVCIDITGFMRHVLTFLIAKLARDNSCNLFALYSEPEAYLKQENTQFATTTSGIVRPVRGMAGPTKPQALDHLVIAVGYDHRLISEVVNSKDDSRVYPIFAFPPLSADMYQQSAIRASESGDVAQSSDWLNNRQFAPANDPFATAEILSSLIAQIDRRPEPANIYIYLHFQRRFKHWVSQSTGILRAGSGGR